MTDKFSDQIIKQVAAKYAKPKKEIDPLVKARQELSKMRLQNKILKDTQGELAKALDQTQDELEKYVEFYNKVKQQGQHQ